MEIEAELCVDAKTKVIVHLDDLWNKTSLSLNVLGTNHHWTCPRPWAAPGTGCPFHRQRCPEHLVRWSIGPSEPRQLRRQIPGCGAGPRRCSPPPNAGSGPSHYLMDGTEYRTCAHMPRLEPQIIQTCSQRHDPDRRLSADHFVSDGLQYSQDPSHRPITTTDQHPEPGHGPECMEAAPGGQGTVTQPPLGGSCCDGVLCSPSQWSTVGNVKDLMRVQELPKAVEQLSSFHASTLWVDEDQQGTDVISQVVVLEETINLL